MNKTNLAVFASTKGTNLQRIIDEIKAGNLPEADLKLVLSNKKDCLAVERAQKAGLKTVFIDPQGKTREEFDAECVKVLAKEKIDLILLIGYARIVSKVLLDKYPFKIINVHPSLLPAFPNAFNLDIYKSVLDSGVKITGDTVYFITEKIDDGPIILQQAVEITDDDDVQSLKAKVQKVEGDLLIQTIKLFAQGRLKVEGKRVRILS